VRLRDTLGGAKGAKGAEVGRYKQNLSPALA